MPEHEHTSNISKVFQGLIAVIIIAAFLAAVFLNAYDPKTGNFSFSENSIWLLFFLALSILLTFFRGSRLVLGAVLAKLGIKIPTNGHVPDSNENQTKS